MKIFSISLSSSSEPSLARSAASAWPRFIAAGKLIQFAGDAGLLDPRFRDESTIVEARRGNVTAPSFVRHFIVIENRAARGRQEVIEDKTCEEKRAIFQARQCLQSDGGREVRGCAVGWDFS
jgi:hypothetical protein